VIVDAVLARVNDRSLFPSLLPPSSFPFRLFFSGVSASGPSSPGVVSPQSSFFGFSSFPFLLPGSFRRRCRGTYLAPRALFHFLCGRAWTPFEEEGRP